MKPQDVIASREYALDNGSSQGCIAFSCRGDDTDFFDVLPEKDEVNRL